MRQVVKKSISQANNVNNEKPIYTLLIDMSNLMKISLVDKRANFKGVEYGMIFQTLYQIHNLLLKKDFNFCVACYDGEQSGILRAKYLPEYKANRNKHYELYLGQSEYDRKINEYCKKVIEWHKSHKNQVKRSETDEENYERQRGIIQLILDELFVRQYIFDNVEGDDLIAYYVKNKRPNEKIVIVSGDRDLTQLIRDDVCVYIPSKKKFVTPENSIEELGCTYENIVLRKIICGDTSDNIKGIKGVAETGLMKLFPNIKTKKTTINEILEDSKKILEERKAEKKKPLKSLENIVNSVTEGSQGDKIYEINRKIIDLSEPMLTNEAHDALNEMLYAPLDPEGRDIKNVYQIIKENDFSDLIDEQRFGNLFSAFERLKKQEMQYYKEKS